MPPSKQAPSNTSRKTGPPQIAIGPDPDGGQHWLRGAITAGGGQIVPVTEAEALMWTVPREADHLEKVLAANEQIAWVQLPYAGIEPFVHLVQDDRTWTCGKGIFAEPVAELALTLALAGLRGLGMYGKTTTWLGEAGRNLIGSKVTILGGGGIACALVRMLEPFNCHITVVRNRIEEMEGVDEVLAAERYVDALAGADLVVLALPLTAETEEMISLTELEMMESHAWIVNIARGKHIVTDDLVWALQNGVIGGAALDVTHPEPLPDDHPLWALTNCIITPHIGATLEMEEPLLAGRITTNIRLFGQDKALHGAVYPDLGVLTVADLDATALVGLLADAHRRRVVAAIELGALHVDEVVTATGLAPAQVAKALGKLVESSLVVTAVDGLTVAGDAFQNAARNAHTRTVSTEFDDEPAETRKVLRSFVTDGRLQSIPVAAAKRMVILDWLAQDFEPGTTYTEKMVNLILGKRHADTAALRRYLVDDGFLDRADGQYWRSGGTVAS